MVAMLHSLVVNSVVAHVHRHPALSTRCDTTVLFLLHGHPARADHLLPVVNGTFDALAKKAETSPMGARRNLLMITLDIENTHEQPAPADNETEAQRVYKKQEHMASTVSMLIDMLPATLSASNNKMVIDKWMVAGVSLGAHAAWMAMDRDPRIDVCIPILGSPDFLDITTVRNTTTYVPLLSSLMTPATRDYIIKNDPVSRHSNPGKSNPFMNKHVLAVAGAQDAMMPLLPTRQFINRIDVGPLGSKRLIIQEGVGHQCTREMLIHLAEFVWTLELE